MGNPLWDYSLATYRLDGVAPTCIELQDTFGLDVNLLLYAAWMAHSGRRLSHEHLAELDAVIAYWRINVIMPLRTLRRQLQGYPPAAGILNEIKALELRAEQRQQEMMYAFHQRAPELPRAPRPLPDNLALVAQFFSPDRSGWRPKMAHLATLIPV